ncbi:MAG: hypothetical protein DRH03_08150 [Deltaproteobacteria bacterium]|nr:MAG: hypothetical protein DRH03_08150 [Deltaproteobacteria bacterium]
MNIANKMMEYLNREGAATPETIAAAIPELSQCGGAERALLLLRLNPQFERIDIASLSPSSESCDEFMVKEESDPYLASSKWTIRGSGKTDDDVVREAAEQYFTTLGRPGAPIANVVMEVSRTTGLEAPKVKQILLMQFTTMNTNIFNRPKRQENR